MYTVHHDLYTHMYIYNIYIYISFSLIIVHIVLLFTISMIIVGDLKHQQ